ncbi:hypothetical protein, partial [Bradyrhizobium sp. Leo170]|uniref:hypothetical protein n=1 Tax=Bradyrhizobium sp. Leo170 TaxID=1571199 RepID=UPI001A928914
FIARGIPSELEERDRIKLGEILQLDPDDLRGPGRTRKWERVVEWRPDTVAEPGALIQNSHGQSSLTSRDEARLDFRKNEEVAASYLAEILLQAPGSGRSLQLVELLRTLGRAETKSSRLAELLQTLGPIDTSRSRHQGLIPIYRLVSDDNALRVVQPRTLLEVGSNYFGNNAYGVIIANDSMAPELRNGVIAIADPNIPPQPGTTCIFRKHGVDDRELYRSIDAELREYAEHAILTHVVVAGRA